MSEENQSGIDKKHREYFIENKWNKNLADILVRHQTAGEISLKYIEKNIFGEVEANSSSLASWKSI